MAEGTPRELRYGVTQYDFFSARDFIEALHPLGKLWGNDPEAWIFRGQADAEWELLPSSHRARSWKDLTTPNAKTFNPKHADDMERARRESGLLQQFFDSVDMAGLQVPDYERTKYLLFERGPRLAQGEARYWPDLGLLPMLALAQHYAIPTCLLDWTRRGRNAAYFAAVPPNEGEPARLVVWALHAGFVRVHGASSARAACRMGVAPRGSNANLHAQDGLFTFCQYYMPELLPLDELLSSILEVIAHASSYAGAKPAIMKKLTLPRECARDLLRLVHLDGVSGLTMFPGLTGVARYVKERAWCGLDTRGTPIDGRKTDGDADD